MKVTRAAKANKAYSRSFSALWARKFHESETTERTELDGMKIMMLKRNKAYNLSYKTITGAEDPNLRLTKKGGEAGV